MYLLKDPSSANVRDADTPMLVADPAQRRQHPLEERPPSPLVDRLEIFTFAGSQTGSSFRLWLTDVCICKKTSEDGPAG